MTFFSTPLSFCPEEHSVLKVNKWPIWSTIGIPGTELSMGPKSIPNWSPPIGGPNMGWGLGYPKMRVFGLTESHSLCLLILLQNVETPKLSIYFKNTQSWKKLICLNPNYLTEINKTCSFILIWDYTYVIRFCNYKCWLWTESLQRR